MITANMHEAKSRLSQLVMAVEEKGETVVICRNGRPAALLVAVGASHRDRLASHPDLKPLWVAPDFDPAEPATEAEWPEEFR